MFILLHVYPKHLTLSVCMQQVQQKCWHYDIHSWSVSHFAFYFKSSLQFVVLLFCRLCAPLTLHVFGRGRSSGLRLCRGSHRCEYHATEVSKGKVRVFSCLVRSLWNCTKQQRLFGGHNNDSVGKQKGLWVLCISSFYQRQFFFSESSSPHLQMNK